MHTIKSKTLPWLVLGLLVTVGTAYAATTLNQGTWTKIGFDVDGGWKIVDDGGKLFVELDDGFRTKKAPDLKIFLSKQNLSDVNGSNATQNAVLVAVLKSHQGAQRYPIPAGTNVSQFRIILIHCEQYSKPWAGSDL